MSSRGIAIRDYGVQIVGSKTDGYRKVRWMEVRVQYFLDEEVMTERMLELPREGSILQQLDDFLKALAPNDFVPVMEVQFPDEHDTT